VLNYEHKKSTHAKVTQVQMANNRLIKKLSGFICAINVKAVILHHQPTVAATVLLAMNLQLL
jgi:hypothetical protein